MTNLLISESNVGNIKDSYKSIKEVTKNGDLLELNFSKKNNYITLKSEIIVINSFEAITENDFNITINAIEFYECFKNERKKQKEILFFLDEDEKKLNIKMEDKTKEIECFDIKASKTLKKIKDPIVSIDTACFKSFVKSISSANPNEICKEGIDGNIFVSIYGENIALGQIKENRISIINKAVNFEAEDKSFYINNSCISMLNKVISNAIHSFDIKIIKNYIILSYGSNQVFIPCKSMDTRVSINDLFDSCEGFKINKSSASEIINKGVLPEAIKAYEVNYPYIKSHLLRTLSFTESYMAYDFNELLKIESSYSSGEKISFIITKK